MDGSEKFISRFRVHLHPICFTKSVVKTAVSQHGDAQMWCDGTSVHSEPIFQCISTVRLIIII